MTIIYLFIYLFVYLSLFVFSFPGRIYPIIHLWWPLVTVLSLHMASRCVVL